ncbi:LysR family transcriptional regulator [Methylobacterium sp. J-088]|uniref:LysR family transcriptional regulator n=1 Tax=Methylobacterium sp. J-088 TaxID=2836664 RepID=UPI001FB8C228|nr:LysR family transcriptional regulator [Methylobacterium sp. J-088]MCJ2066171.1 LysR family transcriptional regulator [Methylobacterium sp. J-088]
MTRSLDIDLLRSFASVAETGALSRAASRIGRSQAALSMQMKRLEDLVGQPLVTRTGRGAVPTVQGERFLIHACRILSSHDEALAEFSDGSLSGTLTSAARTTTRKPSCRPCCAVSHNTTRRRRSR